MAKRIAFVDYKLENFHANVYLKAFRNQLKDRGYEVVGCHAMDEEGGKAWAAKNNVPYFADVLKLNEAADYFVVLAPSNPETHLSLCRLVLPFGKATYVDKTFAPDLATAKQIFELADQHRTPVQTTSALRYTAVQKKVAEVGTGEVKHITTWGGGSSFGEYAIHPVEMAVSCMGAGVTGLMRRGSDPYSQLLVNFEGGRTATVNVYTEGNTPFAAEVTSPKGTVHVPVETATLFTNTAAALLDFFEAGEARIDRAESLAVRRILDAAADPAAAKGFVAI
jgi:predicted dehydrogenase